MRIYYYALGRIKSIAKNEIHRSKAGSTQKEEVQGEIYIVIKIPSSSQII